MKIFLIEDDPDDVELLQEALKSNGVNYTMDIARDGSAAIGYLHDGSVLPDLIILDFNLPKIHGREVIVEIKSNPEFVNIPLLILTTSSSKEDVDYAYKYGADKYLIKPATMEEIKNTVDIILQLAGK